ncbi:uncharacterized protein F5891DRAFT_1058167 [Suillus fuscotomentosus]|uniref:DUF7918 domain-containing protein n=1 Tax=Suillus fuscotomentosus TaxID=1912939 RepID=A0AAD4DWH7_9AGAM|nr:uncharacterized protein F5891DRAFT_1088203 [Suillus fuscotomentosus]XP_041220980.1 uncharacterized protein F5891DRAFT_1058167 [Suillus fuscotomentosus]KAG1885291.1 hypothetical protein F5891DRAFT_1088203 [Suillus fuscotomentosus]KAG1895404.1 hypothetical protein F5891DRAFT_1058167 [Suillus fuscotomentosus]
MILGDFSACIFMDGQELPEYDIVVSSTPTENRITCWIASTAGKKFQVSAKFLARQTSGALLTVFVDGITCRPYVMPPGWTGTQNITHLSNSYVKRDFMFSQLELTDDDSMLDDRSANDIGQIMMEVVQGKYTMKEQVMGSHNVNDRTLRVREGKVHERAKKACPHRVVFGEEVPDQSPVSAFKIIPDNSPKTVFVFKYTRLDILQAMGVAPRTSIMADTEAEMEDHDDDNEVMDGSDESLPSDDVKPLARIRELEMELQRLRAQVEDRKPSLVKLEHGGSRRKPAAMEVIDLTED